MAPIAQLARMARSTNRSTRGGRQYRMTVTLRDTIGIRRS
jgi:hypothetical protein